jgi:hypothetical protein
VAKNQKENTHFCTERIMAIMSLEQVFCDKGPCQQLRGPGL